MKKHETMYIHIKKRTVYKISYWGIWVPFCLYVLISLTEVLNEEPESWSIVGGVVALVTAIIVLALITYLMYKEIYGEKIRERKDEY